MTAAYRARLAGQFSFRCVWRWRPRFAPAQRGFASWLLGFARVSVVYLGCLVYHHGGMVADVQAGRGHARRRVLGCAA